MKFFIIIFLIALSGTTFANEANNGFYIGAGYGYFSFNSNSELNNGENGNLTETIENYAAKIYGGYQINNVLAIELGYTNYGKTTGYIYDNSTQVVNMNPSSVSIVTSLGYSFNNGLRPFLVLGRSYLDLNSTYDLHALNIYIFGTGHAERFGLGLQYSPSQISGLRFRLAVEVDHYEFDDVDYNQQRIFLGHAYSGISYQF